jgi:general secretion pathway protein K
VDNEAEKINPNVASLALLQALFAAVGVDRAVAARVAASIAEWRVASVTPGRSNEALVRYVAAGRDYGPTGSPFTSLDELSAVLGMTPELLARLRPHLTIFSDGDPDLATSDPVVAQALAMTGQAAGVVGPGVADLLSITADARGAASAHFTVRAIVRTNAQANGRRYEILAYEQPAADGR